MLNSDAERQALKQWMIPKLEKISDADAAVLADYVIALFVADDSEEFVKRNCLEQLSDFLHDQTGPFIDQVFDAVKDKTYLPKAEAKQNPIPSVTTERIASSPSLSANAPIFNPPTGPRMPGFSNTSQDAGGERSRKRAFNERESSVGREGQDPHYARGERALKHMARRGARNSRGGGFGGQDANLARTPALNGNRRTAAVSAMPNFASLAMPTAGIPPFDPSNPMALAALLSMGFGTMPSLPLPGSAPAQGRPVRGTKSTGSKGRCQDYDTKGFCALGSACPYEHGGEITLPAVTEEYDPNQALLGNGTRSNFNAPFRKDRSGKGGSAGGRSRAPFSQAGPNYDRSNTTIVVEQIPEESFSEDHVRGFFSQFGKILNVNMQAYKRLAIVEFDGYVAARSAYDSPKVIFDNRFVKVYWYKAEKVPAPPTGKSNGVREIQGSPEAADSYKQDEEMVDLAEVEKRQAEAQKAFEERRRKMQESTAKIEDIEKQLKAKEEEMRALREKLATKTGTTNESALVDQLSTLQAEAQDLEHSKPVFPQRGRGHGGFRGRGFFSTRGRGFGAFRGGHRGRGFPGPPFAAGRGGVKRWDSRPRSIAVSGIVAGSAEDEALRQYLLNNYDYDSIEPHADRADTQVISFKERYVAEMFLDDASNIPDVGKLELAWVPNTPAVKKESTNDAALPAPAAAVEQDKTDAAQRTGTAAPADGEEVNGDGHAEEGDYDVADDDDRWMES